MISRWELVGILLSWCHMWEWVFLFLWFFRFT